MSTLKSSAEDLTLNADGSGNDVIIQSNASTKAIVTAEGNIGVGVTPAMASGYNGLHIGATYPAMKLSSTATGHTATDGFHLRIDSTPRVEYWNYENTDQVFANNDTETMRIDSNGIVTKPLQPAFQAKPTITQTNIAVTTAVTLVCSENWDVGSNFASNTFTAPVTGKYSLSAHLRFDNMDSASNYYAVGITTSNATYNNLIDPDFGQDTPQWHFHQTILADMDASDTATVVVYQATGTQQTDIEHTQSIFSGYLLG